jgi:hypothetical protein
VPHAADNGTVFSKVEMVTEFTFLFFRLILPQTFLLVRFQFSIGNLQYFDILHFRCSNGTINEQWLSV